MTKEREAEIRKHHAPHDPHCNEHCTTRGLLELLDAEREKNAKLTASVGMKVRLAMAALEAICTISRTHL